MSSEALSKPESMRPRAVPKSAARTRKLHSGHFAFMRAIVQGLELTAAWDRYLRLEGHSGDVRLVRSTIAWIREDLAAGARKEERPGTARLVRLDLSRVAEVASSLPSLEAFAEERGLEFESESEQVAAYEAEFGRRSQQLHRRGRLVRRQLEALRWLEVAIAQPPRAGDAVAAWFHTSLSTHLEAANIFTVAELIERINGIGRRWYVGVKALGEGKAARIVAWLKENRVTIGQGPDVHVDQPRLKLFDHELAAVVSPAADIRPLEKFVPPPELDGSCGAFRRPQGQCLIRATTDHQAILFWLRSKHGLDDQEKGALKAARRHRALGVEQGLDWLHSLSSTQRAYRKEAERFLLWAVLVRRKALSSVTPEDCRAYLDFLGNPVPSGRWCGPRSRERWSPLWRPFEGPLSSAAQHQALKILGNLFGFLADQNYLMGSPWSSLRSKAGTGSSANAKRSLTKEQWSLVQAQTANLPETSSNQRLTFALQFLYATGLRISEAAAATLDDLRWVEYTAGPGDDGSVVAGWMLRVTGPLQRERDVPLPSWLIDALSKYLAARGLAADPKARANAGCYLLGQATDIVERAPGLGRNATVDPRQGLAAATLARQLKGFFIKCSEVLRGQGDLLGAIHLATASAHWLRHTHGIHALAHGVPIDVAQLNLGHATPGTTVKYATADARRRFSATQSFWASASPPLDR